MTRRSGGPTEVYQVRHPSGATTLYRTLKGGKDAAEASAREDGHHGPMAWKPVSGGGEAFTHRLVAGGSQTGYLLMVRQVF